MGPLAIRLSRKPDGPVVFACTRSDGTATWQRHHRHAHVFPLHDLAHVAAETRLGLRSGFYGLLAAGWNLPDFGVRRILAEAAFEAAFAEAVVSVLEFERTAGEPLARMGQTSRRRVSDAELDAVRATFLDLAGRWERVPPGGSLDLEFTPPPGPEAGR